jgi:DNA-binding NtrC family response regulator
VDECFRILVVDDDESIRRMLATILEGEGYSVDTAENGQEAVDKSAARVYNLALVDVRLPDIEGVSLLTRFRETVPRMRKIIITGFPSIQNAVQALNNEADGYVFKPFELDRLLETIRDQLRKQQEEKKYSLNKVTGFIETRVRELETEKTL